MAPHEKSINTNFEKVLKKVIKQSGIIFLGRVFSFLLGIFSSIILARLLGTTLLGRYQLGFVTVQIISIFCIAGFDQGLIRFIPIFELRGIGQEKKLILQNIVITLILSTISGFLLYIYSPLISNNFFNSSEMTNVLKTFSLYLPIFAFYRIGSASLIGLRRADVESNIRNIWTPILFISSLGIVIIIGGKLYETILMRMISHIFAIGCVIGYIYSKYSYIIKGKSAPYKLKEYFSFSVPLLLIGLLYFLMGQTDILMLGYFLEEEQVGIYTVVVKIAMITVLGLEIVSQTLAPNISELAERNDIQSLEQILKVVTKWISYFSLFVFFIILIFRVELLKIYGNSFVDGSVALLILAAGQLVNSFAGPIGKLLIMTGKQKWEVLNSISMLLVNILLNFFLIPIYGIIGASIATAISISVINILKLYETYKEFQIHPYSFRYIKGISAISISAVIVYFIRQFLSLADLNYLLIIVIGTFVLSLVTFLIFYFLRFDTEDRMIFEKFHKFSATYSQK
jgi:O-antigen/teichoic acid export membrane protein